MKNAASVFSALNLGGDIFTQCLTVRLSQEVTRITNMFPRKGEALEREMAIIKVIRGKEVQLSREK